MALFPIAGAATAAPEAVTAGEPADALAPAPPPESERPAQGRTAAERDEGRRLYLEGLRAFAARDYQGAIDFLAASYARTSAPALLYDLGQAYRLKGDCPHALTFYRRFLATAPVGRPAEQAAARIADMERCVSEAPAPAEATASRPGPALAAARPAPATPIALDLTARAHDRSAPPAHGWHRRGVSLAVAAAVLASASGYFAWRAGSKSDQVSDSFTPMNAWTMTGRDAERAGVLSDRLAIGTGVGALLAAGLATWAWWEAK